MAQTIAVVRGAFNPPTTGHKCVLERLKGFDKILVVPLLTHSHGREMFSYSKRCEMLKQFVEDTQIPGVEMYAVESEINPHGDPVTVVILLEHLKRLSKKTPRSLLPLVLSKCKSFHANVDMSVLPASSTS